MRSTLLQPSLSPLPRRKVLAAAAFFLLAFALRLATLHSAFHPDDSPETILAGALGGIQHPPSYPLYTLLERLACLTLPGGPAFQSNLLAALLSSLSALVLVFLALVLASGLPLQAPGASWSHRLWILALAAGALTQPQLWFQGLSAKGGIYGLNLLLTLACLGLFWAAREGTSDRLLRWAALLAGLGLADHYMSFILFLPALLAWSWQARPSLKGQARLALWTLPGLSLYLYLPLRALHQPFLNWGDPETWSRFWQTLLRSQYSTGESARQFSKTIELSRYFFSLIPAELTWIGLGLGLVGIGAAWRHPQAKLRPLILCLALHLLLVLNYNNPPLPWVINAFFVPDFALIWLLAFVGAESLYPRWQSWHAQGATVFAAAALLGLLALAPLRYRHNDYSQDFLLYDYNRDLMQGMAPHSALLASGGNDAFGLWYLQGVESRRRDLVVIDVPLLGDWYMEQLRLQLPEWNPAWRSHDDVVQGFLAAPQRPLYYSSHNPGNRGIPLGLVCLVPSPGQSLQLSAAGLLGRFQTLRLRWAADTQTPWDGNREELTEYYPLAAQALLGFAQQQGVAPLIPLASSWKQALSVAREGQRR
jgi:hypothetical protein